MNFSKQNFTTVTISIASPAVFTSVVHELYTDDEIIFETTGALPTGLVVDTKYYVVYNGITADTFEISTDKGGTPIITTGSQSGVHSWLKVSRARLSPNIEDNR